MSVRLWHVPSNWIWATMGEIADVVGGGTPRTDDPTNWNPATVPWVTPADLSGYSAKFIAAGARAISEKGLQNCGARILPAGTVLFSSRAPIGYVAIASVPIATNQGFKSFVPKPGIVSDYLYYFLLGNKQLALDLAGGTTFPEISGKKAATIPVCIPPHNEQQRIVEAIEEYLPRLSTAQRTLRRVQANLKRYRASVLKAACEGRLVPTEAELARREGRDYEHANVLLERILKERRKQWEEQELAKLRAQGKEPKDDRWKQKYVEPEGPDTSGLPELPEGWVWASVDQLTEGSRRAAYGVLQPGKDVVGGVRLIRVGDIENGTVRLDRMKCVDPAIAARYPRTKLKGGELLLTLVGTIGRTAVVPPVLAGANTARAVGVIPLTKFVLPRWVELWFRAPQQNAALTAAAHEVARKTLNLEDVRLAVVALPPLTEQHRIAAHLEAALSVADELESRVQQALIRSDRLRQAILKRAFEGRLIPQDPSDEPAAVLLERIRSQRNGKRMKEAQNSRVRARA